MASRRERQFSVGPSTMLHHLAASGTLDRMLQELAVLSDEPSDRVTINRGNPEGLSPLSLAAERGRNEHVQSLLRHGASVTTKDASGQTALHHSAINGHIEASSLLLEAGALVDAVDENGFTPLISATNEGFVGVMRVLVLAGADANHCESRVPTPLSCAAYRGHIDATELLLLETDADPLKGTVHGTIPLEVASAEGHAGVVAKLVTRVGIVRCGGPSGGVTSLTSASTKGHYAIMKILLGGGVVDDGHALCQAVNRSNVLFVKLLLEHREKNGVKEYVAASPVVGDKTQTPLFFCFHPVALKPSSCKIMRLLIDAGADTSGCFTAHFDKGGMLSFANLLQYADYMLTKKQRVNAGVCGNYQDEDRLHGLTGLFRLLMQEEAIHAVSWLWHNSRSLSRRVRKTKRLSTSVRLQRPRETRPRVFLSAVTRCVACNLNKVGL